MAQARAGLVPRAATSMPETSVIHPDDVARRTLQCIHPACNRDAHPDACFASFCCGACKKTFEAGTITKSSNHGPQCTSGPAGQGLNRVEGASTKSRPELSQSRRSAKTVALGQAMALQRAELQQQQQQMAQRRAEQQQQQMAQELPTRSRSRSAVRSSSAKGLALGLPVLRILVTTLTDETIIHLDVTASDTIEIVKDMIQSVTGTPVKQIRLYSGERELPDGSTLQELHIEHLSRIIMRNDGAEVVRDGEQSKNGEEVVCDEAVGNPHHLFTDNNFLQVNICLRQQFSSF